MFIKGVSNNAIQAHEYLLYLKFNYEKKENGNRFLKTRIYRYCSNIYPVISTMANQNFMRHLKWITECVIKQIIQGKWYLF